jgi:hypothetical protein
MKSAVVVVAAALLLSSCVIVPFPHTLVDVPRDSGRILDASNHRPVPNALVAFTSYPATAVKTDSSGRFTTGISRSLVLVGLYTYDGLDFTLPPVNDKPEGVLMVTHPGYHDWKDKAGGWPMNSPFQANRDVEVYKVGDILLRRLSPGKTFSQ